MKGASAALCMLAVHARRCAARSAAPASRATARGLRPQRISRSAFRRSARPICLTDYGALADQPTCFNRLLPCWTRRAAMSCCSFTLFRMCAGHAAIDVLSGSHVQAITGNAPVMDLGSDLRIPARLCAVAPTAGGGAAE